MLTRRGFLGKLLAGAVAAVGGGAVAALVKVGPQEVVSGRIGSGVLGPIHVVQSFTETIYGKGHHPILVKRTGVLKFRGEATVEELRSVFRLVAPGPAPGFQRQYSNYSVDLFGRKVEYEIGDVEVFRCVGAGDS